jgi:isopenicillin-N epimerase
MTEFGKAIKHRWLLEEDLHFLNHGSFGACPRDVLVAQSEWRTKMEQQPVHFITVEAAKQLPEAKKKLARFVGARDENIVFVENATSGINAVVRSLMPSWQKGDELLTTTHVYGAMRQTLRYAADVMGLKVVEAKVPFPISDPEEVVNVVRDAITPRTKFAIIDHVTSPTGLIYPIEKIIPLLKGKGIQVMIDGAHAPGMVMLDLESYGADFYTGNCHKWMFAPKGAAFLWVAPQHQPNIHAHITSHNYKTGFHPEFEWIGTRDMTPWLSVIAAISFIEEFGAENIRRYNNGLARQARKYIANALGVSLPAPESMIGSLSTIPVPRDISDTDPLTQSLHDTLRDKYRCEVPVIVFGGKVYVRISAQIYNEMPDYEHLTRSLAEIFKV